MWKNRLLFTIVIIFGVGLIIGYKGSNLGFVVVYSMAILLMLSIFSIITASFVIKPEESVNFAITTKNEKTEYNMELKNKSLFVYPRVELEFFNYNVIKYIGTKNTGTLGPFGKNKVSYQLIVPYRGVYRAGIKSVTVTDFLGIFRRRIIGQSIVTLTVYPEYDKSTKLSILNEAQTPSMFQNYSVEQDNTTVADVRDYTFSDNPKNIHWQLSAQRGELMVKNYSPLVTKKVALFLDTSTINLPEKQKAQMEDVMVSYIAGGIYYCSHNNLSATLAYGEDVVNQTEINHESEMERVLEILAKVQFEKNYSSIETLLYFSKDYNNILYLSDINEEKYNVIQQLIYYESKTILYYFYSDKLTITKEKDYLLESLKEYGVEVNRIKII